ncbi:hypothetical protein [Aminobacter sp. HY435]|uniref:hypothetical protein n=1 Tax=Aminobacter sp. HY435 TaxID=2970917 RepID=UPI0022B9B443|nr:hypothetical protein [Aminobacter sp. HY435]
MTKEERRYVTHFGVVSLTTEELLSLDSNERDFILASSFITNDIRFYWSLMARAPVDAGDANRDLAAMQYVRWLWSTRKLASVLYEAIDTLDHLSGKVMLARAEGPVIQRSLRSSRCFLVAKAYRNMSAHHFAKGGLDFDLSNFDDHAEHRHFAHPQQGNSISEIGEQIFTLPTLRNIAPEVKPENFDKWCQDCASQIMNFCDKVTAEILTVRFPNKTYANKSFSIANEAEAPDHRWPLFLVISRPSN